MKCTTKAQAEAIAKAGSFKMYEGKNYTMDAQVAFLPRLAQTRFWITNLDSKARYNVNTYQGICNCPFFLENREFGVCKHLLYARAENEWEKRQDEMFAEIEERGHALHDLGKW